MRHRVFKDRLHAEFAIIRKALASPHRLLGQGERSVGAFIKVLSPTANCTAKSASPPVRVPNLCL